MSEVTGSCQSCGNQLRARARFCDVCGALVATPRAPGEHKQVTVLFADVVGSMKLAAMLDAERLQEIMNELFNRASAVVQRYQGTVDAFTGDGLMALFGAPVALEDHALRACTAALEIQSVTESFAAEVLRHDRVDLRIRVGLNSGDVVFGEIGLGSRYTAVGHSVGTAQRMEAAAPPGGVLCSLTTTHLVEGAATFGPVEDIAIKGTNESVPARQLLRVVSHRRVIGRNEGLMLGRDDEMNCLRDLLESGRGCLIGVVGAPGVGKSRMMSEFATVASGRHVDVVNAHCEAHTSMVAFRVLSRLLRALFNVQGLDDAEARLRTNAQYRGHLDPLSADAQILFEAMGIADPDGTTVQVSVDGRRNRLSNLLRLAVAARERPIVFLLDDVHWVDAPSDAVLAQFANTLVQTSTMFVTTFRPEFRGELRRTALHTIMLLPLADEAAVRLAEQLMGTDPSVAGLAHRVAAAAVGNPFFVEEIVRDLAGRGVLSGNRGHYQLVGQADQLAVPATVQAVIAARIDRLPVETKAILNAAAVIGTRFDVNTLTALAPEATSARIAELISYELIDQTDFVPRQRYCFRHPLVRTVAYESQLTATRKRAHSRLAAAIEARDPGSADENAALIGTQLEAAGELKSAYRWHMRAAGWLRDRDLPAARAEWETAQRIADQMSDAHEDVIALRVAPRTMLISTALYVGDDDQAEERYCELRDLALRIGDRPSLALATAGRILSLILNDHRVPDGAALASELDEMVRDMDCDSATRSIILISIAFARFTNCEFDDALQVIDAILRLPQPEPTMELAVCDLVRGYIEVCRGHHASGRAHIDHGLDIGRKLQPANYAITLIYLATLVALGMLHADELVDETRDAVKRAEAFGDICGIITAESAYGVVLLRCGTRSRAKAIRVLDRARAMMRNHSVFTLVEAAIGADLAVDAYRRGHQTEAVDELRALASGHIGGGFRIFAGRTVEALVEVLVDRESAGDLTEAHRLIDQSHAWAPDLPVTDLWISKSRALLARVRGDWAQYTTCARQYLTLCESLDARGRIAEARAMVSASLEPSESR